MSNMPQRTPSLIFARIASASIISVIIMLMSTSALAGGNAPSTLWSATKSNVTDSGWALSNPTGSSDFFDATYRVTPGIGNVERATIAAGLPITGIAVSVSDFGSGRRYPLVGAYQSNLAIDPSGETPDLSLPITSITSPALSPPALFDFVAFDLDEGNLPSGATRVHAVAQLPPGDSGLLGVGADRDATPSGGSGFTRDGYATPSNTAAAFDLGLNIGQDNSATSSCQPAARRLHGRLRASTVHQGVGEGDQLTVPLRAGQQLDLPSFKLELLSTSERDRRRHRRCEQPAAARGGPVGGGARGAAGSLPRALGNGQARHEPDDANIVGPQRIDRGSVADQRDRVHDQTLMRRLELELELGDALEPRSSGHAGDD